MSQTRSIKWSANQTTGVHAADNVDATTRAPPSDTESAFWGSSSRGGSPDRRKLSWTNRSRSSSGTSAERSPERGKPRFNSSTAERRSPGGEKSKSKPGIPNGTVNARMTSFEAADDEQKYSESDSGVGRESPTHDAVGEWVRACVTTPDLMETSIRSLIQNYSNRCHVYPTGGVLPDTTVDGATVAHEFALESSEDRRQLGGLNCRFENYIDHVLQLEATNISLLAELKTYQEKYTNIAVHLKAKYVTEIADYRELSDSGRQTVARLLDDQKKLQAERDDWLQRYKQLVEDGGHDGWVEGRRLESLLKQRSAQVADMKQKIANHQRAYDEHRMSLTQYERQVMEEKMPGCDEQERMRALRDQISRLQTLRDRHQTQNEQDKENIREKIAKRRAAAATHLTREEILSIMRQARLPQLDTILSEVVETHCTASDRSAITRECDMKQQELDHLNKQQEMLKQRLSELEKWLARWKVTSQDSVDMKETMLSEVRRAISEYGPELANSISVNEGLKRELAWYREHMERMEPPEWLRKTQQFITVVEDTVGYMYMPGKGDDFKQQVCKSVVGSVPRPTRRWETALVVRWDGRQHATGSHILRNNQGTVSIAEVDPEGRYILLENASWKRHTHQFMGGWRLERWLTPTQQLSFTFPDLFKLDQGNTCVIWANCPDATPAPPHQLVWQGAPSWGSGANMETRLVSVQGEEKSTYIERRS